MEFTTRLGYIQWTEYKNSFLIENSKASGCCDPHEYILYSKETGKRLLNWELQFLAMILPRILMY
jgi:hypothetical protein